MSNAGADPIVRASRAVLVLALAGAACAFAPATAVGSAEEPRRHVLGQDPEDVRDFWTRKRMRRADPLGIARREPSRAPRPGSDEPGGPPALIPPSGGPSASRTMSGGGASATETPLPASHVAYSSYDVSAAETLVLPNSLHGKFFFTLPGDGRYVCSATVVNGANQSTILTAGHCVHDQTAGWATEVLFVPGYRDGSTPYGSWVAKTVLSTAGWVSSEDFSHDVGAAVLYQNGSGVGVEDVLGGARGVAFNQPRDQHFNSYGYPAAPPFDGGKLHVCESDYGGDDPTSGNPKTMYIGCDMTGGSSGGGWVYEDAAGAYVNSVNSYKYLPPPPSNNEHMYGPYFGTTAQSLFNAASSSATGLAPGPPPPPAGSSGDGQPPQTKIFSGPKKRTKKRRVRFAFGAAEAVTAGDGVVFRCRLDSGRSRDCSKGRISYRVSLGRHTFRVEATDEAGNTDPTPAKRKFKRVRGG